MKNIILKGLFATASFVLVTSSASAYTCTTFTKPIPKGSESNEVLQLQQFLFEGGYLPVQPSGYFNPLTVTAVKRFQLANGISPVGSVGPITRGKVKEVSCKSEDLSPSLKDSQKNTSLEKEKLDLVKLENEIQAGINSGVNRTMPPLSTVNVIVNEKTFPTSIGSYVLKNIIKINDDSCYTFNCKLISKAVYELSGNEVEVTLIQIVKAGENPDLVLLKNNELWNLPAPSSRLLFDGISVQKKSSQLDWRGSERFLIYITKNKGIFETDWISNWDKNEVIAYFKGKFPPIDKK